METSFGVIPGLPMRPLSSLGNGSARYQGLTLPSTADEIQPITLQGGADHRGFHRIDGVHVVFGAWTGCQSNQAVIFTMM